MLVESNLLDCSLLVVIEKEKKKNSLLINAVNFAKRINGAINILFVINPISLNDTDNQLNFLKSIEEEYLKAEVKLRKLIREIYNQEKIPVIFSIKTGNFSSVVKSFVKKTTPDVVILNNDRLKKNSFGRKIVPDYLNDFNGLIILSGDKSSTLPKNRFNIGCFDPEVFLGENKIIKKLLKSTSYTINMFRSKTNNSSFSVEKFKKVLDNKIKVFEFEPNNKNLGISNYLDYSKSDLLCIYNPLKRAIFKQYGQYKDVINRAKIPLLIVQN